MSEVQIKADTVGKACNTYGTRNMYEILVSKGELMLNKNTICYEMRDYQLIKKHCAQFSSLSNMWLWQV